MNEKKIYTLPEVDKLIFKYKNDGDQPALIELLAAFEGFLYKYAQFLKFGTFGAKDRDILHVINMIQSTNMENTIAYIKNLFTDMEFDDILNELKYLFIKSVGKFVKKKNGPYFAGYLYNYFKYDIKKWITTLSRDILTHRTDEINEDHVIPMQLNKNYENLCLSDNQTLSQLEKYILYLFYSKKMCDDDISKNLGVQKSSICIIKMEAKKKMKMSGITMDDFEI